jgi:hypothetical protein
MLVANFRRRRCVPISGATHGGDLYVFRGKSGKLTRFFGTMGYANVEQSNSLGKTPIL